MNESLISKIFEHNNWANRQIIQVCSTLSDEQLDAEPQSATVGSIRSTLTHLVAGQQSYLSLLTLPLEARTNPPIAFADLQESASKSGEGLLALARDEARLSTQAQLRTRDNYYVAPWVVMLQAINHAAEHREQIKSMLTTLGVTPPDLDGWGYGEVTHALIPIAP
ncbi:MAG: damage-inducible protein DinB [Anaerolineae bacterium]|nr:damage-inducible protein DinB [Anaerolineae bacterium]